MRHSRKIISLFLLGSFLFMSLGLYVGNSYINGIKGLFIGIILVLSAFVFHMIAEDYPKLYLISYFINGFAVGLTASAYYNHYELTPTIEMMIQTSFYGFILTSVFALLTVASPVKRIGPALATLVIIIGSIYTIKWWIELDNTTYSLLFFYSQLSYFSIITMVLNSYDLKSLLRKVSLFSFGAFIVIAGVVILILSEGDAIQGLELMTFSDNQKHKNK